MKENRITAVLNLHKAKKVIDLDLPLEITANELIIALVKGLRLDMDINDLAKCYLKTENPVALLKGNKTLEEYGMRNGVIIHYTK